ncbi:MAG: outer membrane protein assembly factor BamA [Cyclobacteriaceae bacterium]
MWSRIQVLFFILFIGYHTYAQIGVGRRLGGAQQEQGLSINYSSPKEFEIADIEVKGVEFLDNNALISLSGLRVGDKIKIPGENISSAIKKLWKQGIIGNVSIYANKVEDNKVWLTIELTERPRLTKYEFTGVNKSQEGELKDKIDLVRGKVLTDVVIKNTELAVFKYFEGKGYLNAKVKTRRVKDTLISNSVNIVIDVDKQHKVKIKNINFYGEKHFHTGKLRGKLKKTGQGPRFTIVKDLVEKSISLLNPKNFGSFAVRRKEVDNKSFREYLSEHVYLNVFKGNKYVKSDYKEDKDLLIAFYNSKGYRDAEIVTDSIYTINKKHLNIDITVNPGNKYYFRNILWSGNYIYTDEQLGRVLGVSAGDVYDLELIQKKLNFNPNGADISALYMDDGYLFFNVDPVEVAVEGDSIDLEMRIYEGVQATINEITISGNEKTNDHVILRELRTLPGEKFSRADLIRTQRELSQLGYFDPEQVNPVPKPNPVDETVDIEWQLVERANDQVQLSGGWGGAFGFVGTLGVSFNNFSVRNIPNFEKWRPLPMGDGQKFAVQLQANGRQFQSYSVNFTEPWLGGKKPNSFGISFSQSISRQLNFPDRKQIGKLGVTGITLSLGRRVQWPDDYFQISNSIGFLKYTLAGNYSRLFGSGATVSGAGDSESISITFNNTISRSSVDNPMYPRSGSSLALSASFTPPYSLFNNIDYETADEAELFRFLEYHKWNFDMSYYLSLVGDLVLAPRFHFGMLGSYSDKVGVGRFERFTLGGSGLTGQNFLLGTDVIGLRGYEDNSIRPVDDEGVTGGTLFTKFVMELRYPVSLNPSATIYGLTFFEGGNNWNQYNQFNPYEMMRSVGVGVRIFMPAFGLLGLDWAYGLDPAFGTNTLSGPQFHFSIGQQIR